MRALCDLTTNAILQVEKTPPLGAPVPVNGKYVVPVPDGASVQVTRDSVVLPTSDPNSVVSQAFAGLLALFPQYDNVLFNPLITDTDVDDLDFTGTITLNGDTHISRFQAGRQTGGLLVSGNAANSVAVLPVNSSVAAGDRPGVLISDTIDVSPLLPPAPPPPACEIPMVDEVMVWWKIYDFQDTQDVRSDFGALAGTNTPALRQIVEVDQEPAGLEVYVSSDDGQTWEQVNLLEPVCVCAGTQFRIAFVNFSAAKLYVASYALVF